MDVLNALNDKLLYDLEQFLIKNGASIYLHFFLKSMYSRIISGEIIIIIAPIDTALIRLINKSSKSIEQITNLPEGRTMLENFLSSTPIQSQFPVYTAINGAFLETAEDLNKLNYITHIQLGNLFIETVDGIISMPGQLDRLIMVNLVNILIPRRSIIIGDNSITQIDDLTNDIIRKIALDLSLIDIVNNCRISVLFNTTICNNERFWNEKARKDFPRQQVIINGTWKNTYQALSGKLYTFGSGRFGALGHGDKQDQFRPKLVEGLDDVTMVACGNVYTGAISNKQLYTFGIGDRGRLGHGNDKDKLKPKRVKGLNNVTFVACSETGHTAVIAENQLYTFGHKIYGQLGHGDKKNRGDKKYNYKPTLVDGLNNVTMVACGSLHTAAVVNGRLYTFGFGNVGQLGHGDEQNRSRPTLVEGLDNVTFVSCGQFHTAIIMNGQLYSFGSGALGQLGHGNKENQYKPKLVEGLDNVTFVSCGGAHTAVMSHDQLYTFGAGSNGELGHGDNQNQYRPKLVEGLHNVTFVACGNMYTAVIMNGRLYTFGWGKYGRLGHGNEEDQLKPKLVEDLVNVTYVSCSDHTAVIC